MHFVAVVGGDEDDRDVRGAAATADQGRGLESVQAGHVDVEEDGREIPIQHLLQRLLAGSSGKQVLPDILQNRQVDEQLIGPIVDDQEIGLPAGEVPILIVVHGLSQCAGGDNQPSHARSTPTSSSGSTGLER